MRRSKKEKVAIEPIKRFDLFLIVKAAIAASGRADLTFELIPDVDLGPGEQWWLTIHTSADEVDFLVTLDGWHFVREDEQGYFEDSVERPGLSEVLRRL